MTAQESGRIEIEANRRPAFVRAFLSFPVTFSLLSSYVLLILPSGFLNRNPSMGFIVSVMVLAVAGSFAAESSTKLRVGPRPRARSTLGEYGPALFRVGLAAAIVGSIAGVLGAVSGVGSVSVQVGLAAADGQIAAISSLFREWGVLGFALVVGAFISGICSRKALLAVAVMVIGSQVVESYFTSITSPLFGLILVMTLISLLFGVIRLRVALALALAVVLVWPIIYEVRNAGRVASGVAVASEVGAFDRLRFDQQIALAERLPVPADIPQPDPLALIRYGVIPRILDPNRPTLSTGVALNVALGGSDKSAVSFLPPTTIYVLQGPLAVVLWYAVLGWLFYFVWRDGRMVTPARLLAVTVLVSGPLSWFATYPDTFVGSIQSFISAIPLLLTLLIARRRPGAQPHAYMVRRGAT